MKFCTIAIAALFSVLQANGEVRISHEDLIVENGKYFLVHRGELDRVYKTAWSTNGKDYYPTCMPVFTQFQEEMKVPIICFEPGGKEFWEPLKTPFRSGSSIV